MKNKKLCTVLLSTVVSLAVSMLFVFGCEVETKSDNSTSTRLEEQSCGGQGEPCCTKKSGSSCQGGLTCTSGTCTGSDGGGGGNLCGETEEACCDDYLPYPNGTKCQPGNKCVSGTCSTCGDLAEQCCDGYNPCSDGLACEYGILALAPLCVKPCGSPGETCCVEDGYYACESGSECWHPITGDHICMACGGIGQPCCVWGAPECNSGLSCDPVLGFVCVGGSLAECGGSGQLCCEGECDDGCACRTINLQTVCQPCGKEGEMCCEDGIGTQRCEGDLTCEVAGPDGTCVQCGDDSENCCWNGSDWYCNGSLECSESTDLTSNYPNCESSCGGTNEPCCVYPAPACNNSSDSCDYYNTNRCLPL